MEVQAGPQAVYSDMQSEIERLKAIEREYVVTVGALAVVVERLLAVTAGSTVEITDEALANRPDFRAWRNAARLSVEMTVSR